MTAIDRNFNRGFFVIPALTALLFLAGVVLLPGLGTYAYEVQAQSRAVQAESPAVTHNTWTAGTPMPDPTYQSSAGVVKGEIYVVGGINSSGTIVDDAQIYNPVNGSWSAATSLPAATADGAGAVVKNIFYFIGGTPDGSTCSNAVWAYTPKTKVWSAKAAMPIGRCSMGATVEKNIIYVVGGVANGERLTSVESYNPATNTWTEEAPLSVGKSEPAVGLVSGKTIIAADGFTSSGDNGDNEGYNAATNSWTSYKSDPTSRNAACGGGVGGTMYVAGGYSGGGPGTPASTLNESFKAAKNSWTTLAPMAQAAMFSAAALYEGELYCIGGQSSYQGSVLGNVQIYEP
ncbi:MAG: kelch repeat-containing protein [Terriglobales bacterium]